MPSYPVSLIGILSILLPFFAVSASADEPLSRKPGLWEVRTSIASGGAPAQTVKQCIDAATDQMLQSSAGPLNAAACPERNLQRSNDAVTIDSTCTIGGKPATAHTVITGSFDSAYTMTATARSQEIPGGEMAMTMEGKWLGPCAPDQKAGDVIFGNGVKINIPELQQRAGVSGNFPPR
jgi:hypothetical protein